MISIRYTLVGTGWSECLVELDGSQARLTASYLSDALGNLAAATLALLRGSEIQRVAFDEEPGEYRWVLRQFVPGRMSLRIVEFSELWSDAADDEGTVLLRGSCETSAFATAVLEALDSVLEEHGERGYARTWAEHPFPSATQQFIRSELGLSS